MRSSNLPLRFRALAFRYEMALFGHWALRDLGHLLAGPRAQPARGLNSCDLAGSSARSVIVVLSRLLTCWARYGVRRAYSAPDGRHESQALI